MEEPDFWDDATESGEYMKEVNTLKSIVKKYEDVKEQYEDTQTLIEMALEENDESLVDEINDTFNGFVKALDNLRIETLL